MVLESLLPIKLAERKPLNILLLAILYSTIGVFLALWVFPSHASIVMVFLTVSACIPIMINMIKFEKYKEDVYKGDIEAHERAIPFFIFLFLGLVISFVAWFVLLPEDTVRLLFSSQISTIKQINIAVTSGAIASSTYTQRILLNNLRVLAFSILFSFIYGAGAIFILTWNASVIAAAIGNAIRSTIATYASITGAVAVSGYFSAISLGLLRYMIHGIPEITAYFLGGLAGGMISVGVIAHEFNSEKFKITLLDAAKLTLLAILVLIISAIIESNISPLIKII